MFIKRAGKKKAAKEKKKRKKKKKKWPVRVGELTNLREKNYLKKM